MSRDQLRTLINDASQRVELIFRRCGAINPMWHAIKADGQQFILESPSPDKGTTSILMRVIFELQNVVRFVFIDEAWIVEKDYPSEAEMQQLTNMATTEGLANHPDRVEAVMFLAEDESGEMTAHRRIERAGKKRQLGPLEIDEMRGTSEGLFVGMLPQRGRMQ